MSSNTESDDDVVITGMAGQFPNSRTAKEYVDQLMNKVNLCDEDERRGKIEHPEIPKLGGKIHDVDLFDPGNFGIHALHSTFMDPMGRVFMEQVYQALFDAGIHPDELKGTKTGIFTGGCSSEYELCFYQNDKRSTNFIPGTTRSMNAQKVSYCLQLNGPSMNLDTACSSGMYALDAAYRAIREGRCDRAIVGGTNLTLDPFMTLQFARLGVLNSGSGCRPFDNDATGYTRSEAIVAVILQRRMEAKRIYATLVHSKSNADGFKPQGITFPSFDGQVAILKEVYAESKVNPKDIGFVEAHGTGTRVGDPEELAVIDTFFMPTKEFPLLIGSVKGNIGHTEPSAGLCSLVKVLHALNQGKIAPNIHFDKPKVGVAALEEKRLMVVTEPTDFPKDKQFAGINSFGFGGANCHAIVKKYDKTTSQNARTFKSRLVCYSGRSQEALDSIHNAIVTCRNLDYLNLLQASFKTDFRNHLYRGFTIVGENLRSSRRAVPFGQEKLMLILGSFTSDKTIQHLNQLPLFNSILDQCENASILFVLLKTFKELNLPIELFGEDDVSNCVRAYFRNDVSDINLAEKLKCLKEKSSLPKPEAIARWIKSTSVYSKKGTLVTLGSGVIQLPESVRIRCNLVTFAEDCNEGSFLRNIGHLYELGFNPQVQKLYPKGEFPVSVGTDMLSNILKWKHKVVTCLNWEKSIFADTKRIEFINPSGNKDHAFFRGHLIDNRNLYPATGYLYQVWRLYADSCGIYPNNLDIVFENVRFHRACTLSDGDLEMTISVDKSGGFEISENGTTVVTGLIKLYDAKTEGTEVFITEEQEKFDSSDAFLLTAKDAYRELRLRGYNYGGLFRAIQEVTPTVATLKWDNNWITLLDNMMQVCILHQDTRNLYVPVGLERMVIRAREHMNYINSREEKVVKVRFFKEAMTIRSRFIEMRGLTAKSIARRKERLRPVLENYQFVPNEFTTDLSTSVRVNIQLLLECKQTVDFKMAEVIDPDTVPEDVFTLQIVKAIEDLPLVIPDMTIVTAKEEFEVPNCKIAPTTPEDNLLLVCRDPSEELFVTVEKTLIPDGFLLCFCQTERRFSQKFTILTTHYLKSEEKVAYLLRKVLPAAKDTIKIDISNSRDFTWLKPVQDAMKTNSDVVLLAQDNFQHGIMGFTNCLTKEPSSDKVSCVFIQNKSMEFDLNNNEDFVEKQLQKHLKINVFRDGRWGTYRHLLMPECEKVQSYHWYAKTLVPGDLSTLSWVQGAIKPNNKDAVKIMYSALNFRDLMLASGKLSAEAITTDRFIQECLQGFEYVGYDYKGKAVCVLGYGGIANMSIACNFKIEISDKWSLEDAATANVVYSTVIFAFIERAKIEKGQSVLIHSGTGGVGLAALNVCTHFKCDIFVTVGTQEKRDYLLENYPHIKPSHIGCSRNTSFREMVRHETNGRGVDIVLNSLAEEKLQASVECLAHGGVFIEIGKYDLDRNNSLLLDLATKECRHIGVMLDSCLYNEKCVKILKDLWDDALRDGYVKPLPRTIFQIDELDKAFKYMSTGKHIGKVLIKIDHEKELKVNPRFHCDGSKSYVLFGGLGGFGLELADWLIVRGAKHIVLSSRTGIRTGYQRYRISIWKSYGVKVTILMEDVTNYDTCHKALKKIHSIAPIDGVFNLAVVLKDAIFEHQTMETMETAMAPKATLTEHLDKITRQVCPECSTFVVFSSVSCGRGNAGQTNYGYSNSIMERICEMRHASGLPGMAVQWGAVGDVGLLEALQKEHNEIAIGGTLQQKVGSCLEVLDKLLLQKSPIVSSMLVAEKFNKRVANSPLEAVMTILGVQDTKSVSHHTPFPELGMDSMMAVEIKQVLERDFDIILAPNDLRNLTVAKLAEMSSRDKSGAHALGPVTTMELIMLIPGIALATTNKQIVDFNASASRRKGDFILAFPGIDADFTPFEVMSNKLNTHIKCVNYDRITTQQDNVDKVVDYLFNALRKDVESIQSFKFLAHSIGNFAAIELIKRFEAINITGKLVLLDGAPELMYRIFDLLKTGSQEEFECTVLEALVQTTMPQENVLHLKEKMLAVKKYAQRVDIIVDSYVKPEDPMNPKVKTLMFSFHSRLMSIPVYKSRRQTLKLKSDVLLYKPTVTIFKNMADDYNLSTMCEKPVRVESFDGSHMTMPLNDKLQTQLSIEFGLS